MRGLLPLPLGGEGRGEGGRLPLPLGLLPLPLGGEGRGEGGVLPLPSWERVGVRGLHPLKHKKHTGRMEVVDSPVVNRRCC